MYEWCLFEKFGRLHATVRGSTYVIIIRRKIAFSEKRQLDESSNYSKYTFWKTENEINNFIKLLPWCIFYSSRFILSQLLSNTSACNYICLRITNGAIKSAGRVMATEHFDRLNGESLSNCLIRIVNIFVHATVQSRKQTAAYMYT